MPRLIIGSLRKSAGKTSVIVGMGQAIQPKRIGYLKPFGDRLLYRKKRLWDYDAALIENVFQMKDNPEELSLGFDHSKLRFMYTAETIAEKVAELAGQAEENRDVLFIEGGREASHGISVHLDTLSIAKQAGGTLILVLSGDEGTLLDDAAFIKQHLTLDGVDFGGVILNKVHDVEDFKTTYLGAFEEYGIRVRGLLPQREELGRLSVGFLAECIFAKVIAGEEGLGNIVKQIFVGAMSTDAAMRNPFFNKPDKLVITSGDRSDMILSALQGETGAIVLTNNILPPANLISLAKERQIPMLLVAADTYQTAKQVDDTERLLTHTDTAKIKLLGELAAEQIDIQGLLGG